MNLYACSATVAGDRQVRIFDVANAVGHSFDARDDNGRHTHGACLRVLRCHTGRTKRIVTEESSDLFLTVAEVRSNCHALCTIDPNPTL
jgi:WD repeat-containing protein 42A